MRLSGTQEVPSAGLSAAAAHSLGEEVILEDCTDSEGGGVTNVESASGLLRASARMSTASSLSLIWRAAASDPSGRTLRRLVDLL